MMAYEAGTSELHRNAAVYVDKILRGAKPSELPVQLPTTFKLVINLKTAKASASPSRRRCWHAQTR